MFWVSWRPLEEGKEQPLGWQFDAFHCKINSWINWQQDKQVQPELWPHYTMHFIIAGQSNQCTGSQALGGQRRRGRHCVQSWISQPPGV